MDYVTKKEFQDAMHSVDGRFSLVDQRFDAVDKRFDYLEFDLKSFKDEVREGFAKMDKRFDQLFALLDRDSKTTTDLEAEVASAHSRINRIEGHLGLAI